NEEHRVLFVESSKPDLLKGEGYALRSFYTTDQTNEALVSTLKAKFLNVQEMENRTLRLAVLYNDEDWAKATVRDLEEKLNGTRLKGVARTAFRPGDPALKNEIQKLKAAKPDALFVVSLGQPAAAAYKLIAEAQVAPEVYGFAACHDDDLFAAAKDALE